MNEILVQPLEQDAIASWLGFDPSGGVNMMISWAYQSRIPSLKAKYGQAMNSRARPEGPERKIEESKHGHFAWITDSEGNRVELWEPPKRYTATEQEIPSE